jgi:hypothetical protein
MASKIKVDQIQTGDGTGTIALQNQLSGMTSASMPTGAVLQVVSGSTTTRTVSTSATFADTTLSASITPTSASSKILILVDQNVRASGTDSWLGLRILRGSVVVKQTSYLVSSSTGYANSQAAYNHLDSPNTTSATVYKTQFNKPQGTSARVQDNNVISTITLMEIAG